MKPRNIHTDDLIIEWRDHIDCRRGWQWVYGLVATFGIRPHEAFFCEFINPLTLKIFDETKTGNRIAKAIYPEWSERWNLIDVHRPKVTGKTPRDFGQRSRAIFRDHPDGPSSTTTCAMPMQSGSRWSEVCQSLQWQPTWGIVPKSTHGPVIAGSLMLQMRKCIKR